MDESTAKLKEIVLNWANNLSDNPIELLREVLEGPIERDEIAESWEVLREKLHTETTRILDSLKGGLDDLQ